LSIGKGKGKCRFV